MNKKAEMMGIKVLSFWMILIWIIVGFGILAGVWIFFSIESDLRLNQAKVISENIGGCLVDNTYLDKDFVKDEFNLFDRCNIDSELNKRYFYINITLADFNSNEKIKEILKGDSDFEIQCYLSDKSKDYARCFTSSYIVYYTNENDEIKKGILTIKSGSNNLGERL
ncbi:MAG: hypothetical protein WC533_04310 [Candidatus Pacearchaeota archaeon]